MNPLNASRRPGASALTLAAALVAVLLAEPAAARILLLDADFDARAVGSQLQRRGALFGEPVTGPNDRGNETIVEDVPGDRSVRLEDTQVAGFDELYWALRDDLGVGDGKLFISCRLELEFPEDYRLMLRSEDLLTGNFFQLLFDAAGDVSWRDADSPTPTSIGFYPVGVPILLEWEFDLDAGIYNFAFNGAPVLTAEPHGVAGLNLGSLVVGHRDDGDAAGALRFDDPSWSWRPGSAREMLMADFNDKPAGAPLGAGGAELGEPIAFGGTTPVVEVGDPLGTKALLIPDQSSVGVATTTWEFLGGAEPTTPLSVSFWLTLDEPDDYVVYVREQGGAAEVFLDIRINAAGQVFLADRTGAIWAVHGCAFGVPIHVEMTFEPDFDYLSVWWDKERILYRGLHGVAGREPGRLIFGCGSDADLDGAMRVDRIRVHTLDLVTAVQERTPAALPLALKAAPNPFNPATEIAFELDQAGPVRLDVYDGRGRLVRRLVGADLPAGSHRATWRGEDETGRRVASGVYRAVLTSGENRRSVAVTLVK